MKSRNCDSTVRAIDDRFNISKLCVIVNPAYISIGKQDLRLGLKLENKTDDSQPIEKYFSKYSYGQRFIFVPQNSGDALN